MSLPEKLGEKYLDALDYNSAIFYAQLNLDFSPTPGALCLLSKCLVCSGEYLRAYILFQTKCLISKFWILFFSVSLPTLHIYLDNNSLCNKDSCI